MKSKGNKKISEAIQKLNFPRFDININVVNRLHTDGWSLDLYEVQWVREIFFLSEINFDLIGSWIIMTKVRMSYKYQRHTEVTSKI